MNISNRATELFKIRYPIIQGGMIWVSGWKLASAVSNCGGLGLIGAGSMKPELLREHIQKCKSATQNSFGVNLPLMRGDVEDLVNVIVDEDVKIIFSSAGHPGRFIEKLKSKGAKIVHVVPTVKHGLKAESVGCDAVVGEGVEAGGHNSADEITTMCLIPQLVEKLKIPVIAAGGIATGKQIAASFALGAEAAQIGTRFAATKESSAHENYKRAVVNAKDNDTILALKKIGLVRMIKNHFAEQAVDAENKGFDEEQLKVLLGEKRARLGIFEGDLDNGELEAGQSSGLINDILTVEEVMKNLISEFDETLEQLKNL